MKSVFAGISSLSGSVVPAGRGRGVLALVLLALSLVLLSFSEAGGADSGGDEMPDEMSDEVRVRVVGVNDLHGNLLSPGEVGGREVGGVATLAGYLEEYGDQGEAIVVHSGDMFGASPFVSAYFRDEPTVRAMNRMGFDAGVVGNHEFDRGVPEMMRRLRGNGESSGADFPHLAANVVDRETGETLLAPYEIIERKGVRVGFIGVVTPETVAMTPKEVSEEYEFLDLAETVNRYERELAGRGVGVVVVLAHSGGSHSDGSHSGGGVSGGIVSGEIASAAARMRGVDAIFAGHTHQEINAEVPTSDGRTLLVEGGEYGEAISVVDLTVNRSSGEVVGSASKLVTTYRDGVEPDRSLASLVSGYEVRASGIEDRVVGRLADTTTRRMTSQGESVLGDLTADARREMAGAGIGFIASGALRKDLEAGEITYGDLFAVNPSMNTLASVELTGSQIIAVLEA